MINNQVGDFGGGRPLQGFYLRPIGDDQGDLGRRDLTGSLGVKQSLQVRAIA